MISVVIPTYNNVSQLITNLKQNLSFLKGNEAVIVNDDPNQSIKEDLKDLTGILLIENKQNLGFAGAVHIGILQSANRYVMLLNDDVLLKDSSFSNALATIQQDRNIFAIGFAQKEKDGSSVGKNTIYWESGFFQHKKASDLKPGINGWAEGGSCIIDKEKYRQIGGFDSLYSPFYWEDIDLSYRAWKAGFKILFDPNILVIHHHQSTIGKQFKKEEIKTIAYRNQFTFIWKNISNKRLLLVHISKILLLLPVMLFKDRSFISGFYYAFLKLPKILQHRYKGILSDKEILNKFK